MDKFSIYNDIEERIHQCNELTKTPEGKFLAGIVLQRVKDAMGMYRAEQIHEDREAVKQRIRK